MRITTSVVPDGTEPSTHRRPELRERLRIGSLGTAFATTVTLRSTAENTLALDNTVEKWLLGPVTDNGHDGARATEARI